MIFTSAYAGWESVDKAHEKSFFDFEFITWMAWTWQTAAFFIFIVLACPAQIVPLLVRVKFTEPYAFIGSSHPPPQFKSSVGEPSV